MPPNHYPTLARDELQWTINVKRSNRGAPDGRNADDQHAVVAPAKVVALSREA